MRAVALEMGESRKNVIAEKGEPITFTQNDEKAILGFGDGTEVTFLDGVVIHWDTGKPFKGFTPPPPKPTPVPGTVDGTPQNTVAASSVTGSSHGPLREIKISPLPPAARHAHAEKVAVLSIGIGALVGALTFRLFFFGAEDFFDCLRIRVMPGGHTPLSMDWWILQKGFFKLVAYLLLCAGAGLANYAVFR